MSESKHTPGPWAVRGSAGTSVYLLQNYGFSATGWASHNVSEAQARADARLIAAAPDMLEALKSVLPTYEREFPNGEAVIRIRAALAKAEQRP